MGETLHCLLNGRFGFKLVFIELAAEFRQFRFRFRDTVFKGPTFSGKQTLVIEDNHSEGVFLFFMDKMKGLLKPSIYLILVGNQDFMTMPVKGLMEITLSQAALGDIAGVVGSAIKGAAGTVATAGTIALGGRLLNATAGKPSKTAFDIFNEIYEEQPLLTIVTGLTTWTNMVMESFSADRNPANANALVFSAEFSEIKIVTSQIVAGGVPADARDAGVQDLTAGEKQAGKQQAGPVANDSQRQTATSWLYQIVGGD